MKPFLIPLIFFFLPSLSFGQNIGIGNIKPSGPLSFPNTVGPKILLWGANTESDHYGIGYQNSQLQFYGDANFTQVSLGVGQSTLFSELLRIKGDGRVGIYNNNPEAILDVAGRVRLNGYDSFYQVDYYNYTDYIQPAIFFNNNANTAAPFNIRTYGITDWGDITDSRFGIFNSAGKLRLGTNLLGSLIVNGSAGTAGQILRSGDFYGEAKWRNSFSADIYNQAAVSKNEALAELTETPKIFLFERDVNDGYSKNTYRLSVPSRVLVKFDLTTDFYECVACGPSTFDVQITYNGLVARTFRYTQTNNLGASISGSGILTLPAGDYQIALRAYVVSGPILKIFPMQMTVHVIPNQ